MSMAAPDWWVVVMKEKVQCKCVSRVCGPPSSHSRGTLQKHECLVGLLDKMNMVNITNLVGHMCTYQEDIITLSVCRVTNSHLIHRGSSNSKIFI